MSQLFNFGNSWIIFLSCLAIFLATTSIFLYAFALENNTTEWKYQYVTNDDQEIKFSNDDKNATIEVKPSTEKQIQELEEFAQVEKNEFIKEQLKKNYANFFEEIKLKQNNMSTNGCKIDAVNYGAC